MFQRKTIGFIVLVYYFIFTSAAIIDYGQSQLQISIKGVCSGMVIFDETISLIYSPTFFNTEKDRLPVPITFSKQYASQMVLYLSAKLEGKIITNSTQKIKLSRIFFEYKQPDFIEELIGDTLKYCLYFQNAEEVYPQNFHIKIEYNGLYNSDSASNIPKLMYYYRFINSIQDYKSIEKSASNITINIIPSLRILNYQWILATLPYIKVVNDLIETNLLISQNWNNPKIMPQLTGDLQNSIRMVQKINHTLTSALLTYTSMKMLQKEKIGFYQSLIFDVYLKLMEKYKKLAYFDENGYYTLKYSIESLTAMVNGILQIIFTYIILSNLYQNYENHVGVSLIPAFLFTVQLVPSFLKQSREFSYECIFYMIAIGIPCFQIYFGKNKANKLYAQKCKKNDTFFIFIFCLTILVLLFGSLQIYKEYAQLDLLFIITIEIVSNYFMVISILSQIYQNYKIESVRHLKKSYILIVCTFALVDDLRLAIAESKMEVLSLLLADILVVILLLQLVKYNDLGEGTKEHAFRTYLQIEKQKREKILKDIREKLKHA